MDSTLAKNVTVTMAEARARGAKLAPGLYFYQECLHVDPVEWCAGHGWAPTPGNLRVAEEAIFRAFRGPAAKLIGDPTASQAMDPEQN